MTAQTLYEWHLKEAEKHEELADWLARRNQDYGLQEADDCEAERDLALFHQQAAEFLSNLID